MQRCTRRSPAGLADAQSTEVLRCEWYFVMEQFYHHPAHWTTDKADLEYHAFTYICCNIYIILAIPFSGPIATSRKTTMLSSWRSWSCLSYMSSSSSDIVRKWLSPPGGSARGVRALTITCYYFCKFRKHVWVNVRFPCVCSLYCLFQKIFLRRRVCIYIAWLCLACIQCFVWSSRNFKLKWNDEKK